MLLVFFLEKLFESLHFYGLLSKNLLFEYSVKKNSNNE
jgi:hypothetical protein